MGTITYGQIFQLYSIYSTSLQYLSDAEDS